MNIYKKEIAIQVAELLLEIKAVKLSPLKPFTWASGIKSPIYCDNRKILSYPTARNIIKKHFADFINKKYSNADIIAGVATGAIAIGALVADILDKPFIYIRASSKKHGLGNKIEGVMPKGSKVVVIEDLISTGMSSLDAVSAIRKAEGNVLGMCAIFTYGLKVASENFIKENCEITTLSNFDILSENAINTNYINEKEFIELKAWKQNT